MQPLRNHFIFAQQFEPQLKPANLKAFFYIANTDKKYKKCNTRTPIDNGLRHDHVFVIRNELRI